MALDKLIRRITYAGGGVYTSKKEESDHVQMMILWSSAKCQTEHE